MDLTGRLLLFLDVVDRGSYAKAAQLREIDRSVVSKQIRKLEGELGIRLLNRTTRSFSLTDAGQAVVLRARVLRESLVETIETANRFHERPTGHLKIASISPIARTILQPVIKTFMQNYPEVIIELRLDNRIVDIVGEGFDLAFRASDLQDSNLIARTIAPMRMLLVAAPTFLAKHGIPKTVEELAALPAGGYVVDNYRESHINYFDHNGETQQFELNVNYCVSDIELLMQHAIAGLGYVHIPAFLITDEITSGRLVPLMTELRLPELNPISAVYPHRDLPQRTRLFLDAVIKHIGTPSIWERNIPGFDRMYGGRSE